MTLGACGRILSGAKKVVSMIVYQWCPQVDTLNTTFMKIDL